MTSLASRLFPPLGVRAWRLLGGVLAFEIGTGMTLPLVIIYLHEERGLGLGSAGLALATEGVGGLVATLVAGWAADRLGAGWTAVGGLLLAGTATAGYLLVDSTAGAIAASSAQGAGFATTWVAVFPLLMDAVAPEHRGDALGTNYAAINLGLGIGAMLAGVALAIQPGAFTLLFSVDAATYVVFAACLIWLGEVHRRPATHEEGTGGGYGPVLRDRGLLAATGINVVFVAAGYSQFSSAFPAWATGVADAPRSLVGFAFAANTWTIALVQLPMLSLLRGRRRTRAIAGTGLLFAASWLLVLAAGETSLRVAAYAGLVLASAVFGAGETLLSPSLPGIVNDLAETATRGRYVAVYSMSWQIGPMIGPAISGPALAAGHGAPLLVGLATACALTAPAALALERFLPMRANTGSPES